MGELGWELYVPTEFAAGVFDTLIEAGEQHGLVLAGYHALNSLRMEKGYRHWGHDITPDDSPLEGGLGFAIAWDKPGGFIGREALVAPTRQWNHGDASSSSPCRAPTGCCITTNRSGEMGAIVGETTSGMYGHTVERSLAMGYVSNPDGVADAAYINAGSYEIEVAGDCIAAQPSLQPFYDPKSLRVRA